MANFFVSDDLNGNTPTHAQMDVHLKKLGRVNRVLETVWYVGGGFSKEQVFDYANSVLNVNDRLLVIEADDARMRNLLVQNEHLQKAWAA